jgi:hypothetical protein
MHVTGGTYLLRQECGIPAFTSGAVESDVAEVEFSTG